MTKDEAIKALENGEKIRHRYFTNCEYICLDTSGYLIDENGYVLGSEFWQLRQQDYWNIDWYVYST